MIQPLPEPSYKDIEDQNWMEKWKLRYQPISVGKYLEIMPSWTEPQLDPLRIPVKINPGMAFGTGSHPSTQLVVELLEESLRDFRARKDSRLLNVIDVGCGSGILSIAALKLGASHALGVDIENDAIANSEENAKINGVLDRFTIAIGSVKEIREGKFPIKSAPVVLANILAPTIIRLFEDGLGELVEPDGVLILSGILVEQADRVVDAATKHGFKFGEKRISGDWVALVVRR